MQDKKIIELFFKRDEEALTCLIKKYENYGFSIAHNILNNTQDVLEVLNDAYLAIWNTIPPTNPINLGTYLGKIIRNKALDKYRSLKAKKRNDQEKDVSFEELEDCIPDCFFKNNVKQIILTQAINEFLATLSEKERNIFVCRYWYFDSIKDISKRYFCSTSNIKMSLKRSRDKLKDYLIKEGFGDE